MQMKLLYFVLFDSKTGCYCHSPEKKACGSKTTSARSVDTVGKHRWQLLQPPRLTLAVTKPSAAPRTRHVPLLRLPVSHRSQVDHTPHSPLPQISQNSHASLRAALDQNAIAISEDQARTVYVDTPFPRHTPGSLSAAWLAQACRMHPVPFAAVQPHGMFHWPIFPRVHLAEQHWCCASPVTLAHCSSFPLCPLIALHAAKQDQSQHVLKAQMKAQIFGWVFRRHPNSNTLTKGGQEMEWYSSNHQMYSCVWTAAG